MTRKQEITAAVGADLDPEVSNDCPRCDDTTGWCDCYMNRDFKVLPNGRCIPLISDDVFVAIFGLPQE